MRGRIRTIKPEIFSDEELWDLGEQTGLPVLQVFAGLWCFADKEGRFQWRPRALRALIVPYWQGDFDAVLHALARARFIVGYVVDGRHYAYIRNWHKHQRPDHREPDSSLPAPTPDDIARRFPGETRACPGGTEGNGTEGEGNGTDAPAREPPFPAPVLKPTHHNLDGWEPSEALIAEAAMEGIPRPEFDRRLKDLRGGPIGGARGVFDRDDYVRRQFGKWRLWGETERAKAAAAAKALAGKPGYSGSRFAPVLEPTGRHRAYAKKHGLDLDAIVAGLDPNICEQVGARRALEILGEKMSRLVREQREPPEAAA